MILGGMLLLSVATYAYAAANIVPPTKAGEGTGIIDNYVVSSITYVLNANDPRYIDRITLTVNDTAAIIKVKVGASSASWYNCTLNTGFNWSCAITSPQVLARDAVNGGQLHIAGAQ